ncbi:MAG: hypothetical protein ABEJ83_03320 [Candidatus Nanohaloarchaea archaeon]
MGIRKLFGNMLSTQEENANFKLELIDSENESYNEEAVSVSQNQEARSTITLMWGVFMAELYNKVQVAGIEEFCRRTNDRISGENIHSMEDIEELSDFETLQTSYEMDIITGELKDRAEDLLDKRNSAAHYNTRKFTFEEAEDYSNRIQTLKKDLEDRKIVTTYQSLLEELRNRPDGNIEGLSLDSERVKKIDGHIRENISNDDPDDNLFYFVNRVLTDSSDEEIQVKYLGLSLYSLKEDKLPSEDLKSEISGNLKTNPYLDVALSQQEYLAYFCKYVKKADKEEEYQLIEEILQVLLFRAEEVSYSQIGKVINYLARNNDLIRDENIKLNFKDEFQRYEEELDDEAKEKLENAGYNF